MTYLGIFFHISIVELQMLVVLIMSFKLQAPRLQTSGKIKPISELSVTAVHTCAAFMLYETDGRVFHLYDFQAFDINAIYKSETSNYGNSRVT